MTEIPWLEDEDYRKAIWQLRMQLGGIFDFLLVDEKLPVRYVYGLGAYIEGAVNECVKL